jgi:hypothetical protein
MTRSDYYLGATLEFEFLIFINCRMWDRLLLKQKIPGEREVEGPPPCYFRLIINVCFAMLCANIVLWQAEKFTKEVVLSLLVQQCRSREN